MADTKVEMQELQKKFQKVKGIFDKRIGYLLGVLMGLVLIVINVYIGLYLVTLMLDQDQQQVLQVTGISLPVIYEEDYENAEAEYLKRQDREFTSSFGRDPFKTRK